MLATIEWLDILIQVNLAEIVSINPLQKRNETYQVIILHYTFISWFWNLQPTGQKGIISCFSFNTTLNGLYAAGSYDESIGLYSENTSTCNAELGGTQLGGVTCMRWSPCGNYLWAGGRRTSNVICWDVRYLRDEVGRWVWVSRGLKLNHWSGVLYCYWYVVKSWPVVSQSGKGSKNQSAYEFLFGPLGVLHLHWHAEREVMWQSRDA